MPVQYALHRLRAIWSANTAGGRPEISLCSRQKTVLNATNRNEVMKVETAACSSHERTFHCWFPVGFAERNKMRASTWKPATRENWRALTTE